MTAKIAYERPVLKKYGAMKDLAKATVGSQVLGDGANNGGDAGP